MAEANLLEAHKIYTTVRGAKEKEIREGEEALVDLYTAWHATQPGGGYDIKAAEWKAKPAKKAPTQEKK